MHVGLLPAGLSPAGLSPAGLAQPLTQAVRTSIDAMAVRIRAFAEADTNQSTLGIFVGRTALKNGKGTMHAGTHIDGSKPQPSEEQIRKLRPAGN